MYEKAIFFTKSSYKDHTYKSVHQHWFSSHQLSALCSAASKIPSVGADMRTTTFYYCMSAAVFLKPENSHFTAENELI